MPRRAVVLLSLSAALAQAGAALAEPCLPPSGVSTCFDADALWISTAPGRLVGLDTLEARDAGGWFAALASSFAERPVVLVAPSPDPDGRELPLVARRALLQASLDVALDDRLSARATLGVAWHEGSGAGGAIAQRSEPLDEVVLRDPRIGVAYRLLTLEVSPATRATAAWFYDLSLPLGGAFAGARSLVAAPGLGAALHHGRLVLATQLDARLTSPVELAGTRLGSKLFAGLGGAYQVVPDRLSVGLELWLWPNLLDDERRLPNGDRIETDELPAEWLLSAQLEGPAGLRTSLGFGTGLPLSTERRTTADGSERSDDVAGVGTPRWRATLRVGYAR